MIDTGVANNYLLSGSVVCPDITDNTIERTCCSAVLIGPFATAHTGTAMEGVLYDVPSYGQAVELFGLTSPLARMAECYFASFEGGELQMIGQQSTAPSIVAPMSVINVATSSGTITISINQEQITVSVVSGDTAATIRDAIADAINARPELLLTAIASGSFVQLSPTFNTALAGQIVVSVDMGDVQGVLVGTPDFSTATGTLDMTPVLDALGDCCCYDFVGFAESDTATMEAMRNWFADRWDTCDCFVGGRYYNAVRGNFTDLATYATDLGGVHRFGTTVAYCESSMAAPWEVVAGFVGQAHRSVCINPSLPWSGNEIGCFENDASSIGCGDACFPTAERNALANMGLTVTKNGPNGLQVVDAEVGLGSPNALGDTDLFLQRPQPAYQTMLAARLFAEFSDELTSQGTIITGDDQLVVSGTNVMTVNMLKTRIISFMDEYAGTLFENIDEVTDLIDVQINSQNPSRVDACVTFDLVSAFRTFATRMKMRVQTSSLGDI